MARCPDCNGPAITIGSDIGDGKCSWCHGTGISVGKSIGRAFVPIPGADVSCTNCDGGGKCQTCGGSGEVENE